MGVMVIGKTAVCPGCMVIVGIDELSRKVPPAGVVPVPFRVIVVCVPATPPESLVMVTVADLAPAFNGAKAKVNVQVAFGASVAPQVFDEVNSVGFAPANAEIFEIFSVSVPVLVSVTVCDALVVPTFWGPKLTVADGVRLAVGEVPVPVSATVRGLPAALSTMV